MEEKALFNQYEFFRQMTLHLAKQVTEEEADVILNGFPNSIRWNVGHILVSSDNLINHSILGRELKYPELSELFNRGTRPQEWAKTPPSMAVLVASLEEQLVDLKDAYEGKLNVPFKQPFNIGSMNIETGTAFFNFALIHETLHIGHIKTMINAVRGAAR